MSRRLRWLGAILCLLALPVAAAGIAVVRLDPNDYKPALIAAVQDATGRTLSLNGPLRVSRSLWPTLEATDVTLANLPGGSRPDMAQVERIEASLSLPALLRHRIEVTRLTLVGPNILFETADGKLNWVFDPPGRAGSGPVAAPGTPFQLRVRSLHVQNGMVTWRLPARTKVVGIRALEARHDTDDGPLDLAAVLVYSDNQPFNLRVAATPTAGLAGPWTTRLDFAAFDTTASATGTMDVAGGYDLQVEARSGTLARLNALLPEMRLPAARQATLSSHITNGPRPGDLPVLGRTRLQVASADLAPVLPGLKLGAATASLPEAGALATLEASAAYEGQAFNLAGTLGIPRHPDQRASLPLDLAATAPPATGGRASGRIGLKGRLALNALAFEGLDAALALRTPALAALRPILTPGLPALTGVSLDGRIVVPARPTAIRFSGAKLLSHQGDIAGDGTIALATPLALEARLHAGKLDGPAMLAAFGVELSGPAAPDPGGTVIPDLPLPWATLRGPALDVSGTVGTLSFGQQSWQDVELALRLKGGHMQLGSIRLAMPAGKLAIAMTADASSGAVPVSLSVQAPGVPLALIGHYFGLPGPFAGALRIQAQLQGTGRTLHSFAGSLDGSFQISATGGQLSNAALVRLTGPSLDALGIKVPAQGETTLRCLGLAGSFGRGLGTLRTIALDTTYLSVEGVGTVDLGREMLALRLQPLALVAGSEVAVPVVVEGPFRGISGRLEARGLGKLGLLFDGLFGGDRRTACADAGLLPQPGR